MELTDEDGLKRYKRIDAQLRRLCERKPSGRLNVPLNVHEMWAKGGKDRDELRMMFEQYELNKNPNCMHALYLIDMLIFFGYPFTGNMVHRMLEYIHSSYSHLISPK